MPARRSQRPDYASAMGYTETGEGRGPEVTDRSVPPLNNAVCQQSPGRVREANVKRQSDGRIVAVVKGTSEAEERPVLAGLAMRSNISTRTYGAHTEVNKIYDTHVRENSGEVP